MFLKRAFLFKGIEWNNWDLNINKYETSENTCCCSLKESEELLGLNCCHLQTQQHLQLFIESIDDGGFSAASFKRWHQGSRLIENNLIRVDNIYTLHTQTLSLMKVLFCFGLDRCFFYNDSKTYFNKWYTYSVTTSILWENKLNIYRRYTYTVDIRL